MKKPSAFVLILSFLLLVLLPACNNSVEDMLDDYNGGFKKGVSTYSIEPSVKSNELPQPGDLEFKEDDMLYPIYRISQNSTLNLAAPGNCSSYRWTMTDPEDDYQVELRIKLMEGSSINSKRYVLYVPQSGLYASKTFKLTLTVHGNDGYDYTDVCGVAVYKDYYFSSNSSRSIESETASLNIQTESMVPARMILPESYSVEDSGLEYYLYARNEVTEEIIGPKRISVAPDELDVSGKSGSLLIELPPSDYYLGLYCCKAGEVDSSSIELLKASALLAGYANADLRYNKEVVFCMTSKDITYPGKASLKIFTDGWNLTDSAYSGYTVSAKLLKSNYFSGDISESEAAVPCSYLVHLTGLPANAAPSESNFVALIDAGTYTLKITFSNGTKTFSWTDNIVILAGKTTEATIGLPLLIFNDGGGG